MANTELDEIQQEAASRLAVALDGMNYKQASSTVEILAPLGVGFKGGFELITLPDGAIDRLIEKVHRLGGWFFYDIKLHDIPKTMENAMRNIAAKRVRFVNLHGSAGILGIEAAVKAREGTDVLVVTVLTSISVDVCVKIYGGPPAMIVPRFAREAREAGAQGIVCSAQELDILREAEILDEDFIAVVPGIRFSDAKKDDQKRVMGPREAIEKGANILVVGRPITQAENPAEAAMLFINEIAGAM